MNFSTLNSSYMFQIETECEVLHDEMFVFCKWKGEKHCVKKMVKVDCFRVLLTLVLVVAIVWKKKKKLLNLTGLEYY